MTEDEELVERLTNKIYAVEGKRPGQGSCGECHWIGMVDAVRGLRMLESDEIRKRAATDRAAYKRFQKRKGGCVV